MLERYWTPNFPYLEGLPFEGRRLDPSRPEVYLVQAAGNVTTGTHKYKIAWLDAGGTTLCTDYSRTITTDTASSGQVVVVCPLYAGGTGVPVKPTGATGWNVYRTEAGGSTYKLVNAAPITTFTCYVDNIADGSLGAAEPGSKTSTTVNNPTLLSTNIASLTAGSATDFLVAYFIMQRRWTLQSGAGNNTLLLVPGTWTTDAATYKWPVDPQGRGWNPDETASSAQTIPAYSTEWESMKLLIFEAEQYRFIFTTIDAGTAGDPLQYTITVAADGGGTYQTLITRASAATDVPLEVCKGILTVIHDPDWY